MFPFPLGPIDPEDPNLPEPLRSMLQRGMDRAAEVEDGHHAAREDRLNAFWQFMDGLRPDQLGDFREIIITVLNSPQPTWLANRLEGQADAIMRMKYPDLCHNCGRATCGSSSPTAAVEPDTRTTYAKEVDRLTERFHGQPLVDRAAVQAEVERQLGREADEAEAAIKADEARLMVEYNIVPNPAGPTDFKCGNCGVQITSLEDRMRREPGKGGCSGCRAKEAHG